MLGVDGGPSFGLPPRRTARRRRALLRDSQPPLGSRSAAARQPLGDLWKFIMISQLFRVDGINPSEIVRNLMMKKGALLFWAKTSKTQ